MNEIKCNILEIQRLTKITVQYVTCYQLVSVTCVSHSIDFALIFYLQSDTGQSLYNAMFGIHRTGPSYK